jgi:hypothetical protein
MDAIAQDDTCRIWYRYTPSGKHTYRVITLRNLATTNRRALVYRDEVHGGRPEGAEDGPSSGFGGLPRWTKFTRLAKEKIRDGGAVLSKAFGQRCIFTTGTFRAGGDEQKRQVASWSGYLIQRLKQKLVDAYPGCRHMYVWELHKRGTLHLHCVLSHEKLDVLQKVGERWSRIWFSLLEELDEIAETNWFSGNTSESRTSRLAAIRTDAQWARKAVGRYLSKYLSKTSGTDERMGAYAPSRWWGVDNWLRERCTEDTVCVMYPVQTYCAALERFEALTGFLASVAEKCFAWSDKFNPLNKTVIGWIAEVPL